MMVRCRRLARGAAWAAWAILAMIALLAVAGCGSTPDKVAAGLGPYASLYDGKDDTAFATLFPVTSAAEAIQRGDLAMTQGDLDRALFEYIRALGLEPKNADTLYKIGAIHDMRGNQPLAEMAFRWSLKENPRNVGSLTGLGVLLPTRPSRNQTGLSCYG